jgi:phospholipid transport system substrate-binding protein
LRRTGNSFKVIDLAVEGVSMSVTHRTDFGSVISSNGGKVQALIDALKDKEKALALGD